MTPYGKKICTNGKTPGFFVNITISWYNRVAYIITLKSINTSYTLGILHKCHLGYESHAQECMHAQEQIEIFIKS